MDVSILATAELWRQYRQTQNEDIQQELVVSYLWLVKYLAGRLYIRLPACMGQEDLESCGVLGLLEAVKKYDPDMGRDFEAYASRRIRGAMLDEIRKANWIPRTLWQKLQQLRMVREKLEKDFGEVVPHQVLAEEMGITVAELHRLESHRNRTYSLSLDEAMAVNGGDHVRLGDMIQDSASPDPLDLITEEDNKCLLIEAIDSLNEKDKLVLSLYYHEGLTLKEIGRVLEVSESRVCQLHSRAIQRLRKKLTELMAL